MKYLLIFLTHLFIISSFAKDGYDYKNSIDNYEGTLNLQYIGMDDTLFYLDEKNKQQKQFVISNLAIYNITKDSITYLFKDTIVRDILDIYFESSYVDEYKTIEFNNEYNPKDSYNSGLFKFSNNFNLTQRPISNNLIILTQDPKTYVKTIWIADKHGNNLRKVFDIDASWDWEIDVRNRQIRISRQVDKVVEIKNENY